jgi:hypothetical protein
MVVTGEGKGRRGDYQETLADASSIRRLGLGCFTGMTGTKPWKGGGRRLRIHRQPVNTVVLGVQRAPGPVRVSRVWNV